MKGYRIIADSGSTKTDWVITHHNQSIVGKVHTMGFNPYFQTTEFIRSEVQKGFETAGFDRESVSEIHFYGAGCSSMEKSLIVEKALAGAFPNAEIHVDHDLIAAARATLGTHDGIACILGTGANSCVWQGGKVVHNIPSHGYIFGDEGSGSYLGIRLVKLYVENRLDRELTGQFEDMFRLSREEIINKTYREPNPNVFLASFASFFSGRIQHPVLEQIMRTGFEDFFKIRVALYPNFQSYPLGFVGSIAFYYRNILEEVADP